MKLEVGMYVRGKYYAYRGKIGKIIKNYNNDLEIAYTNGVLKTTVGSFLDDNMDINGRQYVASFNIIDLIEEGDILLLFDKEYGEKYKAEVVTNEENFKSIINYEQDTLLNLEYELIINEHIELLKILTKEQFYVSSNPNSYRLINTFNMNLTCYILEDYVEEEK